MFIYFGMLLIIVSTADIAPSPLDAPSRIMQHLASCTLRRFYANPSYMRIMLKVMFVPGTNAVGPGVSVHVSVRDLSRKPTCAHIDFQTCKLEVIAVAFLPPFLFHCC